MKQDAINRWSLPDVVLCDSEIGLLTVNAGVDAKQSEAK